MLLALSLQMLRYLDFDSMLSYYCFVLKKMSRNVIQHLSALYICVIVDDEVAIANCAYS